MRRLQLIVDTSILIVVCLAALFTMISSCSPALQRDVLRELGDLAAQVCVKTDPVDVCVSKCSAALAGRDAEVKDAGAE